MSSLKIKAILKQIDPNALKIAQLISKKDEEMKANRAELKKCTIYIIIPKKSGNFFFYS